MRERVSQSESVRQKRDDVPSGHTIKSLSVAVVAVSWFGDIEQQKDGLALAKRSFVCVIVLRCLQ